MNLLLACLTEMMYNNRPWSDLKDIAWWDRPPRTPPVPAARPPRPDRPRIYSRRTRRCRLPGIVKTGCFSPWGGAASVRHASLVMCGNGTDARMRECQCREPKAQSAVTAFICQQEGAAVTSPPATASPPPHIPAERTEIPTGAETELHTMVTLSHGVSGSCDATMEFCSLYIKACITRISNKKVLLLINLIHYLILLRFLFYCIFIFI